MSTDGAVLWKCRGYSFDLSPRTFIMGILNVTPDSFSDGGAFGSVDQALAYAHCLIDDGADIIDIGGESTRPGATSVSSDEEIKRTVPLIRRLSAATDIPISIDTRKSTVAAAALEAGCAIVNDVSGLSFDPAMAGVIARSGAGCVLMHMRGEPDTMQQQAVYADLINDIIAELRNVCDRAAQAGIARDAIVLDPGIGFAKTGEHNLIVLNHLDRLTVLDRPLLVGTSRKSFIGGILHNDRDDRLMGTAASISVAILRGARIVRVHDVKAMRDVSQMTDALMRA